MDAVTYRSDAGEVDVERDAKPRPRGDDDIPTLGSRRANEPASSRRIERR